MRAPGYDESRQETLRRTIARLASPSPGEGPEAPHVDVVVSHVEVNDAHGTGLLTKRLFGGIPGLVSIRSHDLYGGSQDFGDVAVRLVHDGVRATVLRGLLAAARGAEVSRAVCIPYFAEDVATALALKDVFAMPLCTFVMDDNNVEGDGIADGPLRELLVRSELRLAISPELRCAYEEKFGLRFWLVPPLVAPELIAREPLGAEAGRPGAGRGLLVGNVWGADWLERLGATVRGTGVELDWYSNGPRPPAGVEAALAADGIRVCGAAPEERLLAALRAAPYVLVPSGTLDATDTRRAIARFSLPSRIPYALATAQTPLLVLGHPGTAAARFVTRHGVGVTSPYDRDRFVAAVAEVTAPASQAAMRARAAALGPLFSAEGARDWIWRSLALGEAVDHRFEHLVSERKHAC